MLSTRFRRLVLILFLAALAIRLFGLNWDSGHWFHPDERRIAEAVQEIQLHPLRLDPKFFAYGSFPFYVTRAAQGLVSLVRPSLSDYRGSILIGRGVSAFWGALTVVLLVLLGRRLYGERTGLLAGLLLATAVLHLQNSHFATNDVALAFLILLALTQLVRAGGSGSARDFGLAGLVIGLAIATKISALPLFLPLVVAVLADRRGERAERRLTLLGLASATAALGFALGEPYALVHFRAFSHDVLEQSQMVRAAGALAYTTQYMGTPKVLYDLREHLLWGLGPFLGLAGLWGAVRTYRFRSRAVSPAEWILLSFALPFFVVTASFDVKFLRYLLPLYPLVCLWAARWLTEGTEASTDEEAEPSRRRRKRILRGIVVGATGLYAAAFLGIYTRPHTIITASRWFYANIPKDSAVLSQDWDEGFPFDVDGRSAGEYRITNFPFYDVDSDEKIRKLARSLCVSEAAVFQTKRLYGAVTQAPGKYPRTDRFFHLLFAGDLGFQLEKEVVSRPGFFGLGLLDELADESFSVYDHPKVVVFRNKERLSASEIELRALVGAPSRPMTRQEILLAPHGFRNDEAPGRFRRSGPEALALLLLFVEGLGLAGYAVLRRFFPPRPGIYALGKIAGLLLFSFGAWLPIALGLVPFTRPILLAVGLALGVAAVAAFRGRVPGSLPLREIAWTEGAVWGSFLVFVLVRAANPEIFWGEKPMDFSFLNSLYRTVTLPPVEPWFAGSSLSYTYFGHFSVAAIGKALAIPPSLMFNLAIALVASLAAAGLFAAGAALGNGIGTGLLATALGLFAGNLSGLRELAARKVINFDTFWATSRVIPETINEYPLWSFLFADLHAHMLAVPFALGLVALLLNMARQGLEAPENAPPGGVSAKVASIAFAGLFLGAAATTNGWGTPTWIALSFVLLFPAALEALPRPRQGALLYRLGADGAALVKAAATSVAIVAGALILFRPFWASFAAPDRQIGWEKGPYARVWDSATHFGLFFFVLVPFLFLVLWRAFKAGRSRPGLAAILFFVVALLLVPATLVAWKGGHPLLRPSGSIRDFAALMTLLGAIAALHPRTGARERPAAALAALGFALVAGCEVVYLWDRMNTVFKYYFDAWLIFSISSALVCRDLAAGLYGRRWSWAWKGLFVIGATASLVTVAVALGGALKTNRVGGPRGTLDGMAYLRKTDPDGAALYAWIGRSIPGLPAIAEAWGPSYQEFSRVSMNTGLPTVLGWDYHLFQRGKSWEEIDRRKADLRVLYTAQTSEAAGVVLGRYRVRYVVSGPLESRTYLSGRPPAFDSFDKLLKPVFRSGKMTLYEVSRTWRSPTLAMLTHWSPFGSVPVQVSPPAEPGTTLREPRGIVWDKKGNLFVADFGNNRIVRFDYRFTFQTAYGTKGSGPGEFDNPCAVTVGPDGNLYVADTWNGRVQVLTREGSFVRQFGAGMLYGPRGIAVDRKGRVYVSDTGNNRVVRFSTDGVKDLAWGGPGAAPGNFSGAAGIAVDAQGTVFVCDNGNGRLQLFSPDGKFRRALPVPGWRPGPLGEPQIALDAYGVAWVTIPLEREVRGIHLKSGRTRAFRQNEPWHHPFRVPLGIATDPTLGSIVITDDQGWVVPLSFAMINPDH